MDRAVFKIRRHLRRHLHWYLTKISMALVVTSTLSACGKFGMKSFEAEMALSPVAQPLLAEQEDAAKLATTKEVPAEVRALFAKERAQSDAALLNETAGDAASENLRVSLKSIARLNDVVLKRRAELVRIGELAAKKSAISKAEQAWIKTLAREYKALGPTPSQELLLRVDAWPASLVLAAALSEVAFDSKKWPGEELLSKTIASLNTSDASGFRDLRRARFELAKTKSKTKAERASHLAQIYASEILKSLDENQRMKFMSFVNETILFEGATP